MRTLTIVNLLGLAATLIRANSWSEIMGQALYSLGLLQPLLLSSMLVLYSLSPWLMKLPHPRGQLATSVITLLTSTLVIYFGGDLYLTPYSHLFYSQLRYIALTLATTALVLTYFSWRSTLLSPAVYQARLQALQARIRPHFLFNCINTVLSIVRSDPRRAETALEDMSDLFRMAMEPNDSLVSLRSEIDLSQRYLNLEKLRLGDRLSAVWHTKNLPRDALVPPLILQPLLENAIYHGIEPLANGGTVNIHLGLQTGQIVLDIRNPCLESDVTSRNGNKIALDNIRERLSLLFDIEAHYTVERSYNSYNVQIAIPYIKEGPPST